jgi:acyl-CoA thioesterase-1
MNWLLYLFGSGAAFFVGAGLVLAGVVLVSVVSRRWLSRAGLFLGLLGLILIAFSATPLPYWFYVAAGLVSLIWLATDRPKKAVSRAWRIRLRVAVAAFWLAGVLVEIPYHLSPVFAPSGNPELYILGDSITAGIEGGKETWPLVLARSHSVQVYDHSSVGATVGSVLRKIERVPLGDGLILVELGGNDLLGSTSVGEFERDLDQLLGRLCTPGRVVLLFELPLPPFCNEFGRAQRRVAARHRVQLVPKRLLISVLTTEGATVDSLHLSPRGHELMAAMVWNVIRPAYGK